MLRNAIRFNALTGEKVRVTLPRTHSRFELSHIRVNGEWMWRPSAVETEGFFARHGGLRMTGMRESAVKKEGFLAALGMT